MFEIYLQNNPVGTADVRRKGLYYEITCRCRFADDKPYRIYAVCGNNRKDLGVCVPFESGFGFRTTVAIKLVGQGDFQFEAIPVGEEKFTEVSEEKDFPYLAQLRKARFCLKDGKPGVIFPK